MPDALEILGKNIKFYRNQLGLTQEELGVNRSHLAGIECGNLNPAVKTIEKLADALNITVSDLFASIS